LKWLAILHSFGVKTIIPRSVYDPRGRREAQELKETRILQLSKIERVAWI